jgi:2'-5' RNA ligase
MRLFVALFPDPAAVEDLEEFLAVRREAGPELRWTSTEQWHLTLAFMPDVAERQLDELVERLGRVGSRQPAFDLAIAGGGAFPDPGRAKVLWAGLETDTDLGMLATRARSAGNKAGASAQGGRFRAHVTLARSGRPIEASRWVRVLDTYRGPTWQAGELVLVESHLGEGPRRRPRYEVVDSFPFG